MSAALTASRPSATPRAFGVLARTRSALAVWNQRRKLASLDEVRLADLGLSREEALAEANRPFWDVPALWRVRAG